MKKCAAVLLTVFCVAFAVLLSACGQNASPTSEVPTSSEEEKMAAAPDLSFTPPPEEPSTPSMPPVEEKPKPWAIVKEAAKLPLLTPEPTKTILLPDKTTVTATYVGKKAPEQANTTPLYTYVADNDDLLRFDAVGGELVYYRWERYFGPFLMQEQEATEEKKEISIDEALAIAQTFAGAHIDLSRYAPPTRATWGHNAYHFQYVRYIGDMPTQETVDIYISRYGKLIRYEANPHLFDCIQIGAVDKAAMRQRFEKELLADGYWLDYILQTEAIGLNDLGAPCVKYEYYYELKNGSKLLVRSKEYPLIE